MLMKDLIKTNSRNSEVRNSSFKSNEFRSDRFDGNTIGRNNNNFKVDVKNSFNKDLRNNKMIVKRGEIFYADLGIVEGSEQGGIRPVIIISCDAGNLHSPTAIVASITSQINKAKLPVHIEIEGNDRNGLEKDSVVLLEQVRTLDKKRLKEKTGCLNDEEMQKVDMAILISLGINLNAVNNYTQNNNSSNKNNVIELKSKTATRKVQEEYFDVNNARRLVNEITKLDNRISEEYRDYYLNKFEDERDCLLAELKTYCKKHDRDYTFFYKKSSSQNVQIIRGAVYA